MQGPSSTATNLAVYGDPIVCRALALLLKCPDYDVRIVPASALSRAGSLKSAQALLLAPGQDTERRKILAAWLQKGPDDVNLPILELAAACEEGREPWGEPVRLKRRVPWPCSIDELKRHIEAALSKGSEAIRTTRMAGMEAG